MLIYFQHSISHLNQIIICGTQNRFQINARNRVSDRMVFKIIIFWIGSFFFTFFSFFFCKISKYGVHAVFGLMLLSLVDQNITTITFFTHPEYKQATRGFEVHLADLCALVLFAHIMLNRPRSERIAFPPLMFLQLLFILVALMSWMASPTAIANPVSGPPNIVGERSAFAILGQESVFYLKLYPLFEISKLLRGMLIFWVTVNLAKDPLIVRVMYGVIGVLLVYFTIKALILRYVFHENRVSAGIGHYNNFNTFVGLLGAFILPLAFSAKRFITSSVVWFLVMCTLVCIILTISRSALFAFALTMIVGAPILLLRFFNIRNLFYICLGVFAFAGLLVKAQNTLMERFVYQNPTSAAYVAREALIEEAKMMAREHVVGVGMGNFSAWSILQYSKITGAELGNFAHNSFYLTLGELGYPGLIIFCLFWVRYFRVGIAAMIRRFYSKDTVAFTTIMGANLAIFFLLPQLWFQFTYRATSIFLLVHIFLGIGVGQYLFALADARKQALVRKPKRVVIKHTTVHA